MEKRIIWLFVWATVIQLCSCQQQQQRPRQQFERRLDTRQYSTQHNFIKEFTRIRQNPTYLILASKIVRPGSVYSVIVSMMEPTAVTDIMASVSRDGVEIAAAETTITGIDTERLLLRIPRTSLAGNYQLRVIGSSNDILGPDFQDTTKLTFSPRFLTILVHTNRPVYNDDARMLIRVIILTMDLKPYSGPVNVNILDKEKNVMASYRSIQLNVGVGKVEYKVPRYPSEGWWTIQVMTYGQLEEQKILVEKYYWPKYEIDVVTPEFLVNSELTLAGEIGAAYLAEGEIVGNITRRLTATKPGHKSKPVLISEEFIRHFQGSHEFEYDLEEVKRVMPLTTGTILTVEADVHEHFFGIKYPCFAKTVVIDSKVVVQFLGPQEKVFKPGMPFRIYLAISYNDLAPLQEDKLSHAKVRVQPIINLKNGQIYDMSAIENEVPEDGVIKIDIAMPPKAKFMLLKAIYEDEDGDTATNEIAVPATHPHDDRVIHVYSTDSEATIGNYIVVHVQANFYMKTFHFMVISKGIIEYSSMERMEPLLYPIKTISIPVSPAMAPSFEILVYHVTRDGFLIVDSVVVPVNQFARTKASLIVNPYKDKTGKTVELGVIHIPGSFYGITVRDAATFCFKCGGDFTKATILENLHKFDETPTKQTRVKYLPRGNDPDEVYYYDTSNPAIDTPETLRMSGLVVFTDTKMPTADRCNRSLGLSSCKDGQCYRTNKRCDGSRDCTNGYDEIGCNRPKLGLDMNLEQYRIYRRSRTEQFFDVDGDWGWIDFNTDDDDFFIKDVPARPSEWLVTGFAMVPKYGLTIQEEPILYDGNRIFFATIEMPERCKAGEQIGVRVDIFNNRGPGIFVTVVLKASDDYKFVHVEEAGRVKSYGPRTSSGEHQHQIYILPYRQDVVYMPIVFTKLGEIDVTVEVWTYLDKIEDTVTVTVVPDGAQQRFHTSLLLDLKTHPQLIKYLDINVIDSPIVPYFKWRRYLYDSPRAHVSLVGDVFGPVYPPEEITTYKLIDKPFHTAEAQTFTFGATVWMLHYLRLTNQLTKKVLHESFASLRYHYGSIMRYCNKDGSFSMFEDYEPSVWLTAFVAKTLQVAVFSDWENFFYIDPNVISKAVQWIINHQTPEGSFVEVARHPLNNRMNPKSQQHHRMRYKNIPLTAFVLITLGEINDLPGQIRIRASTAKLRATSFLEKELNKITDAYETAIVAYALTLVNSVEQEVAFRMLDRHKYEQEGNAYWSSTLRNVTSVQLDNQRYLIQPRLPFKYDALSVEASAYALLVYIAKEGLLQENIVRWLNTMRGTDGGFISTQDTLVAMQALTEFTFRARLREVTDMRVTMRPTSTPEAEATLNVNGGNLAELQIIEIPKVWGIVEAIARGSGLSIAQLDVSYSVDHKPLLIPPAERAFDLSVTTRNYGRNSSHIAVRACQRWILTNESPQSGIAVFEMDVPTGYYQDKPLFFDYVRSKKVRNLRRMAVDDRKIYAYFDYLDGNYTCIDFTIQRWFPVANMSQYNLARVYEYHSPERYNESIFHSYDLYILDVCLVCGSYQCPYCPYYSGTSRPLKSLGLIFITGLLLVFNYEPFNRKRKLFAFLVIAAMIFGCFSFSSSST